MPPFSGEKSLNRFHPEALAGLQEAIHEAGGREVFFAGALAPDGRVERVRVLARGNASAVPALFEGLDIRDVVVHNHPSGDLTPSSPDLTLASMYGAHGHGMFIVDNEAHTVYVVVEPFTQKKAALLKPRELETMFRPNGPMARHLQSFEVRPQQAAMLEAIADAFNTDTFAVIEAPTGVGKTMAYLLPALVWALRNKERVVVSTRTINLQEQIMFKDIPLLRRCLGEDFEACLVKGRNNYLCRRKMERAFSEMTLFEEESTRQRLEAIAEWAEHTEDGSLSDLPFVPGRELWEKVNSEADTCPGSRCPNQQKCFVGRARRAMGRADLLVVNHHMLFSDLALKKEANDFTSMAVLPVYHRVILDEAHAIEDSATEYMGVSATRAAALILLGRLLRTEGNRERGLLPLIRMRLTKECPQVAVAEFEKFQDLLDSLLLPAYASARQAVTAWFNAMRGLAGELSGQIGRDIKWRLTPPVLERVELREMHTDHTLPTVESLRQLARLLDDLSRRLRGIPSRPQDTEPPLMTEILELNACRDRMASLANVLSECTSAELQENTVRWIEMDSQNEQWVRVVRCPLDVGKPLAEWVYEHLKTMVMTSATLTVERRFDYLFHRLGLNLMPEGRVSPLMLDSPFDHREQAMVCIPTDMMDPADRSFLDESVESIRQVLKMTRGHAFVLFTSFYALNHSFRSLEEELRRAGITPLCQGKATRTQLLDEFRRDMSSVLFATDSFWEGVDVAGEALQCVILPKLPFRVPTEPILEARAEAIEAAGGNAFMEYSVPQAVIKFRQGFGRLIRRRSDWGAVVILDKRVITKYYGRIFLKSLPDVPIIRTPRDGVYNALETFFNQRREQG
ncbi:MAG: DEAD/DEAH box helicase family protein [Candidatus Hydrogenedens sp.]|nr:DEAD/DEAH box helicase family protein [Candidatus Hydrogenedentota bacterium]NLF58881.1 DEAD/DEAH box helicase family protein [Candidatus Hydrogenedens sp.]